MNGYSDSDLVWVTCAYCRRNKFRVLQARRAENNYCSLRCKDSGVVAGYKWSGNNLPMAGRGGRKPGRKTNIEREDIAAEIADGAPPIPPGEEEAPTRLEQIKELEQELDSLDILSHEAEIP